MNTRIMSTHVTIAERPFEHAAKVFAEQLTDVVPHAVDPVAWDFGAGTGYVAGSLEEWPEDPPVSCLFLVEDDHEDNPADGEEAAEEEDAGGGPLHHDPARFLSALNLGNAMGTWNCTGEATWFPIAGGGFASFIALENEQANEDDPGPGDYVDVYLSVWPVAEGWAVALLRSDERDVLLSMLGLEAWPSNTESVDVSYGE